MPPRDDAIREVAGAWPGAMPDVGPPLIPDGGEFSPGTWWGRKAADIGAKLGYGAMVGLATLPRRAIENSQHSIDSGTYDPGPVLEGATLPMGTGAIAGVPVRGAEAVIGAGPIRAYHGSPHSFDRFDISKIGTGEGAQAYGHGLYFAEDPRVARTYHNQLSDWKVDGLARQPAPGSAEERVKLALVSGENDYGRARAHLDEQRANLVKDSAFDAERFRSAPFAQDVKADWQSRLDALDKSYGILDRWKKKDVRAARSGNVYEVDINADPAHFLDWDVQSTKQSDHVKSALREMGMRRPAVNGKQVIDQVANDVLPLGLATDAEISRKLLDHGIPGIRYLDAGSRAAKDGTRNYVVFNDKLIDIVKKYGLAGLPAGGALAMPGEDARAASPGVRSVYEAMRAP